ncbi:MAG: pilus assembly protein [Calditrichaeota bacterium]|nr:pilus assembly protein [Calditrichota bacterium]
MLRFQRKKRLLGERGQSLAEFALVLPLMLVILAAIIEFGRAMMTLNVASGAAREGVRVAATGAGSNSARQAAINVITAAGYNNYSVSISGPDGNNNMRCTVTIPHTFLTGNMVPGLGGQLNISHTAVMRWEG